MEELTAAQHLAIARDPARPNVSDYIQALFTDFFEQRVSRGKKHFYLSKCAVLRQSR